MNKRFQGWLIVTAWYAIAILSFTTIFELIPESTKAGFGDILSFLNPEQLYVLAYTTYMTMILFIGSVVHRNSSIYDAYWSVAPPVFITLGLLISGQWSARELMMSAVVFIWAIRLTANWVYTWPGMHHQDWRYTQLRKDTGLLYPLVNFTGIHFFPTLMVYVAFTPAILIYTQPDTPLNYWDWIALLIGLGSVGIQGLADYQMHQFRKSNQGKINNQGLWKYSRHPNYLGEIGVWLAVFTFGLGAGLPWWPYILCPLSMAGMFVVISIPMMEKRQSAKPGWEEYKKQTGKLLPKRIRNS